MCFIPVVDRTAKRAPRPLGKFGVYDDGCQVVHGIFLSIVYSISALVNATAGRRGENPIPRASVCRRNGS